MRYVLTDLLGMACDGGVPRALSVWTQLSGPTTGSVCVWCVGGGGGGA